MQKLVPMIALILALTGCAAIRANETHWTEQLLTAAGFQAEPAATAEELAHLRTLEARVFVKEMQNGEARYVYADPDVCQCLYVGSERQYQTVSEAPGREGDRRGAGERGEVDCLGPLVLALALIRQVGSRRS